MGSHWELTLLYLKNVLYCPEDDRLRSKHVAVMWPECIRNITVLIYCCVLTVYNTLYKFRNIFGYSLLGPRRKQESYNFSIFSLVQAVSLRPLREEDRVRFVAEKCALRQVSIRILLLYPVSIIPSMLHILHITRKTN